MPKDENTPKRAEEVLDVMRDGEWRTATQIGDELGFTRQRVQMLIKILRDSGHVIEFEPDIGWRLTREVTHAGPVTVRYQEPKDFGCDVDEAAAVVADLLDDLPPGAEAPPCPPLRPFAGASVTTSNAGDFMIDFAPVSTPSRELGVLAALEEMDGVGRERVLFYAFDRWGIK